MRCTPNYEADRAEILHSFGASFAQLKKIDLVMSGHGAMTSLEVQGQAIFLREIAEYGTLKGDIEASFDYFRSELACMTLPPYPLTFWSRSGQSQGQGQASDLG